METPLRFACVSLITLDGITWNLVVFLAAFSRYGLWAQGRQSLGSNLEPSNVPFGDILYITTH